jgi:hypothetical protein
LCCNSLAAASYVIHTNNEHPFRSRSTDKSERECKGGGCEQIGIFLEYSDLIWRVRRGGAHNMIFVVLGYFWSLLWEVINNRIKLFLVLSCVPFQNLQLPMYIQNIALKNAIGKV